MDNYESSTGVPAHGIQVGTSTYNQESFGWRQIQHPFPNSAVNSTNASNSLLRFRVLSDNSVNYGGTAADGWEGIMIDDISINSAVGTPNHQEMISNFTKNDTAYIKAFPVMLTSGNTSTGRATMVLGIRLNHLKKFKIYLTVGKLIM